MLHYLFLESTLTIKKKPFSSYLLSIKNALNKNNIIDNEQECQVKKKN
jgi:hypothetical protein